MSFTDRSDNDYEGLTLYDAVIDSDMLTIEVNKLSGDVMFIVTGDDNRATIWLNTDSAIKVRDFLNEHIAKVSAADRNADFHRRHGHTN